MTPTGQRLAVRGLGVVAAGLLLLLAVISAWVQMQTRFMPHDDEGLVLYALKNYLSGHALYEEFSTQYGPAYFLIHQLILGALHWPVTHDAMRRVSLACWLAASLAMGWGVYRFTRSGWLAVLGFLASYALGSAVTFDPGHPQALLFVLLGFALPIMVHLPKRKAATLLGIVGGLLFCIKVNQGALFSMGLGWALICASPMTMGNIALRGCAGACILVLPSVLLHSRLNHPATALYALITTAAVLNLVISQQRPPAGSMGRPWLAMTLAIFAACLITILPVLYGGTGFRALFDGMVGQHLGFDRVFWLPPDLTWRRLNLAVVSGGVVTCAIGNCLVRSARGDPRHLVAAAAVLKLALAVAVLFAAIRGGEHRMSVPALLLPWMWIVILPLPGMPEFPRERIARLALLATGSLHLLLAHPVAGNQQSWAMLYLVALSCLLLADVGAHWRSLGFHWPQGAKWIAGAGAVSLAAWPLALSAFDAWGRYRRHAAPVALHGASCLRLTESELATYECLVLNARINGTRLLTIPGMYSFCLWSDVDSPTMLNQTNWPFAFDDETQARMVADCSAYPRTVAIRNEAVLRGLWQGNHADPVGPLVRYLESHFVPTFTVGSYEFLVPRMKTDPALIFGAWWVEDSDPTIPDGFPTPEHRGDLMVCAGVPATGGRIHGIELIDPQSGTAVTTGRFVSGATYVAVSPVRAIAELNTEALHREGLNLSGPQRVFFVVAVTRDESLRRTLVVRLRGSDGTIRLRLPFLKFPR